MSTLTEYLEKYALISLEKQEKLARLAAGHTVVELDFDAGMLRFSDTLEFRFQVLGTESDNTLNWLWAWADEQAELNSDLLASSLQMKEWGAKVGLPEFTAPSVDLEKADGHVLSMIASEVCAASCYYQDSYDGGALFLLLFGESIDQQPAFDVANLSRQFSNLISLYELNHRNTLVSYLDLKGLPFTEQGTAISWEMESAEHVRAEFDPAGRLQSINGKTLPLD
jgi:hypothetical protein